MSGIREAIELNGDLYTIYLPRNGGPGTSETHIPELATDQPDYTTEPLALDTWA